MSCNSYPRRGQLSVPVQKKPLLIWAATSSCDAACDGSESNFLALGTRAKIEFIVRVCQVLMRLFYCHAHTFFNVIILLLCVHVYFEIICCQRTSNDIVSMPSSLTREGSNVSIPTYHSCENFIWNHFYKVIQTSSLITPNTLYL